MSQYDNQPRPIEKIEKAIDKHIFIKLKGKRGIKAVLRSYDEHLNLFLEECIETYRQYDQEREELVNMEKELDSIILRGDNVVFLTLEEQEG
ncbi:MAG: LSM domain-containing protein [Candidatus Hodarchaeota archaeon]